MTPLNRLLADEFEDAVGFVTFADALRSLLARRTEVSAIREALAGGLLTEDQIRAFVSSLVRRIRWGTKFAHENALAAIAVALEPRPTAFAEEFLGDLSRIQAAEFALCSRVARQVLERRAGMTRNQYRHTGGPVPLRAALCSIRAARSSVSWDRLDGSALNCYSSAGIGMETVQCQG